MDKRAKEIKQQFLELAKGKFSEAWIDEYVSEAEHQDGNGYWLNFASAEEVVKDLKVYVEISEGLELNSLMRRRLWTQR